MPSMLILHFDCQFPWKGLTGIVQIMCSSFHHNIFRGTNGTRGPPLTFVLRQSVGKCLAQIPIVFEMLHVNIFGKPIYLAPRRDYWETHKLIISLSFCFVLS